MGLDHSGSVVAVSTSAVTLAAANSRRIYLMITNLDDADTIYFGCGGATPTGAADGLPLGPGASYELGREFNCDTSLIQAIAPAGDCNIYVKVG